MTEQESDASDEDAFFTELASAYGKTRLAFARQAGMSLPRLRMLMTLWRAGETSHSDLRGIVSLDGASVTRLVKEFESEGLVSRRVDPEDNRYVLASLTSAGEGAASELDQRHREFQHRLLDGIAPREQRNLRRALRRLSANVDRVDGGDDT